MLHNQDGAKAASCLPTSSLLPISVIAIKSNTQSILRLFSLSPSRLAKLTLVETTHLRCNTTEHNSGVTLTVHQGCDEQLAWRVPHIHTGCVGSGRSGGVSGDGGVGGQAVVCQELHKYLVNVGLP